MLRSATAAYVLSQEPYNFNTRSVGVESYAMIPLTDILIEWADEIVCMGNPKVDLHEFKVTEHPYFKENPKPIRSLNIPDRYPYRDPKLVQLIKERFDDKGGDVKTS
jgi:predicted protein tyrosine phosphatase